MRLALLASTTLISLALGLPAMAQTDNGAAPAQQAQPAQQPLVQPQAQNQAQQPAAQQPAQAQNQAPQPAAAPAANGNGVQVAQQCLDDIDAFNQEATGSLQQSGVILGGATRDEIRRLTDAARVFATNGNQDACEMVLAQIRDTFSAQTQAFTQANPDINAFRSSRTEELAAAVPVSQAPGMIRADDVIGSSVRSSQDEDLGSIDDVIVNPADGTVQYVLLTRGGFLGMGEDYVPVRWADLRVTQDGDIYVLNMTEDQFENAPTIDAGAIGNNAEWQNGVETWWNQNMQG